MSVDFPLPETPVINVSTPSGMFTSISLRLCSEHVYKRIYLSVFLLFSGRSICSFLDRYLPVSEFGFFSICSGVPSATISPP